MPHPNFIILYVTDAALSAPFYANVLDTPAIESSPTFAMFALESGVMLGLWNKQSVLPACDAEAGSSELAFAVADQTILEQLYQNWQTRGMRIAQPLCMMDFGWTFVALDPDGNRLRAFVAAGE
ncbi:extradiol dioxygenase [Undibacterium amnicola]|uniref:Extradiol dioxygenase n=1 Tax=Undibacterium amnicola TaxID=1834038 RepID=A0ABR6XS94_9BURK|nr:VOC family protein [Undibacterium amnicola]MBC3832354.1 extradiol dioxygenase [Undibacterium amnicola]